MKNIKCKNILNQENIEGIRLQIKAEIEELVEYKLSLKSNVLENSRVKVDKFFNKINNNSNNDHLLSDILKLDLKEYIKSISELFIENLIFSKDLNFLIKFVITMNFQYDTYLKDQIELIKINKELKDKNCFLFLFLITLKLIYQEINLDCTFLDNIYKELMNYKNINKNNIKYFNLMNIFLEDSNNLYDDLYDLYKEKIPQLENEWVIKLNYFKDLYIKDNQIPSDCIKDFNDIKDSILNMLDYINFYNKIYNKNPYLSKIQEILIEKNYYTNHFNIYTTENNFKNTEEFNKYQIKEILINNNFYWNSDKYQEIINNIKFINKEDVINISTEIIKYKKVVNNYIINILNTIKGVTINIYNICYLISLLIKSDTDNLKYFNEWIEKLKIDLKENKFSIIIKGRIMILIELMKFGTISSSVIFSIIKLIINNLGVENSKYLWLILNNCQDFFINVKNLKQKINNIIYLINKNKYKIDLFGNSIEYEFKKIINVYINSNEIFEINKEDNPYWLYLEEKLSGLNKNNIEDFNIIFLKLPISNYINEIKILFINFLLNLNKENYLPIIIFFKNYLMHTYPIIVISILEYLVEFTLDSIENYSYSHKKQKLIFCCLFITECYNYELIGITEISNFYYSLLNFKENNSYNAYYDNDFNRNNQFPITLIINSLNNSKLLKDNPNTLYLLIIYIQIYILNLNYLDLSIEIMIKTFFNNINKNIWIIKDLKEAQLILDDLKYIENNNKIDKLKFLITNKFNAPPQRRNNNINNTNNFNNIDKNILEKNNFEEKKLEDDFLKELDDIQNQNKYENLNPDKNTFFNVNNLKYKEVIEVDGISIITKINNKNKKNNKIIL